MSDEDQAAPAAEGLPEEPSAETPVEEVRHGDVPDGESSADRSPEGDSADADQPARPDDGLTYRERRELRLKARREKHRERRIWTAMVLGGIVVLGVFMYFFWPVIAGRLNAAKQMDQAVALLDQAKPTVASIDKAVAVQLSPDASAGVTDTATQALVARRELKQAIALLDDALPHLTDDEQKRANLILASAQARLEMVDRSGAILRESVKAVKAKAPADQAWKATQSASAAETAAVTGYKAGKATYVAGASASLARIKGQLGDARILYRQAAAVFPAAGFDRYVSYIDLRNQALKLLSQATTAWLAGDTAGAALDFAAYQRAAAKAAAAGAKLPPAPSLPGQTFRKAAGRAVDSYTKAKKQAAAADKALTEL